MGRFIALLYGLICYVIFLAVFLYAIGFTGNLLVPKAIDGGTVGSFTTALLIDVLLLGLFAVQHTVMARPGFKAWWTRIVPKSVERATFVLATNLVLILLFWQWRPLTDVVWQADGVWATVLWVVFWLGWAVVLLSTFMIDHFELFGVKQVLRNLSGASPAPLQFKEPGLYKLVRHPIMLGFLLAFWGAPVMTVGHLVFTVATTGYILIGV